MGLLSGSMESLTLKGKSRRESDASTGGNKAPEGNPDDTSTLDKEEGNVLMTIISQRASLLRFITYIEVAVIALRYWRPALTRSAPWHGFVQDCPPDFCAGAAESTGAHY